MTQCAKDKWELFVFDWDGTVMDTTYLIARALQEASLKLGYAAPTMETARAAIGMGWAEIIQMVCPECPPERYDAFCQAYRDWYIHREATVRLYEHMPELLQAMHQAGLRLAVATGKSRLGLNRVFGLTGIGPLFEATRTADESFSKPNPAMLYELSDETGVPVDRMVMIGDTTHDLLMAQNAGCDGVGLTYGAGTRQQLESIPSLAVVDSVRELADVLGLGHLLGAKLDQSEA